ITPETRLVLANAIYFNGKWEKPFNPGQTSDANFSWGDGTTRVVQMMEQTDSFNYTEDANDQILELPYQGDRLSMVIVLPKYDTASTAGFSPDQLSQFLTQFHREQVIVEIPKFQMDTSYDLRSSLSSMGMPTAFSDDADLSGFGQEGVHGLKVSDVIH